MPITVPRILIFDDIETDGIEIAKGLWRSGFAARFIHWDEEIAEKKSENNIGVRIVFMDIDLLGDGIPSPEKAFNLIMQALALFLDKNNGPYALITWSTYSHLSDDLFAYLNVRMPALSLVPPVNFKTLDKEYFKKDNWARSEEVAEEIKQTLSTMGPIGCLTKWEGDIQKAGAVTIQHLLDIALRMDPKEKEGALTKALWAMAKAEGGNSLKEENAFAHLNASLSSILYDRVCQVQSPDETSCGKLIMNGKDGKWSSGWQAEIHSLFHLDFTSNDGQPAPGDVFICPQGDIGSILGVDPGKCLRGNFLFQSSDVEIPEEQQAAFNEKARLLLVEITPPCDYAQNKHVWNRFVLAAQIPSELMEYTWIYDKNFGARLKNKLPEFLWDSPEFIIDKMAYQLIFNSKLILSLPKKQLKKKIGERCFRIRQSLMADMIGWLARQNSRLGHVSLYN